MPFDDWDWQRNDPEFYKQFNRIPVAQNEQQYQQIKWRRWNMATKEFGKPKRDFTPKVFMRKMKLEIGLFMIGVCGAFYLPTMMRNRAASRAGPQDATTARYMAKQQE